MTSSVVFAVRKIDMYSEEKVLELYQGAKHGAFHVFGMGVDIHTPETVASDVVADVLRRNEQIERPFSFGYIAGRNKAIAVLRMHVRIRAKRERLDVNQLADSSSIGDDQDIDKLNDEILNLPPTTRRYILLKFYGGYSVKQIALITGDKPRTIQARLTRTLQELRLAI